MHFSFQFSVRKKVTQSYQTSNSKLKRTRSLDYFIFLNVIANCFYDYSVIPLDLALHVLRCKFFLSVYVFMRRIFWERMYVFINDGYWSLDTISKLPH